MSKCTAVLCVLVILVAADVRGEILQVPLSDLQGAYTWPEVFSGTATVSVRPIPGVVRAVSLALTGYANVREYICDLTPYREPVFFEAFVRDPITGGYWWAGVQSSIDGGPVNAADTFEQLTPASWAFLSNGEVTVSFTVRLLPVIDTCSPDTDYSDAQVYTAVLVIDGDFPIPVGQSTWGRVKAMFETSD